MKLPCTRKSSDPIARFLHGERNWILLDQALPLDGLRPGEIIVKYRKDSGLESSRTPAGAVFESFPDMEITSRPYIELREVWSSSLDFSTAAELSGVMAGMSVDKAAVEASLKRSQSKGLTTRLQGACEFQIDRFKFKRDAPGSKLNAHARQMQAEGVIFFVVLDVLTVAGAQIDLGTSDAVDAMLKSNLDAFANAGLKVTRNAVNTSAIDLKASDEEVVIAFRCVELKFEAGILRTTKSADQKLVVRSAENEDMLGMATVADLDSESDDLFVAIRPFGRTSS